ncbi:MAG: cation transporter [Ruminococcaceae bacterium]|nr:cation transporter [Oscillospiraceae bacterium]
MFSLLSRIFIKQPEDYASPAVRRAYGMLASFLGIALNVLLFLGKYLAGAASGSIAVMSDAFNNLSDAASSVVTLIGFRAAGKQADEDHPFGHGRMEYIAGFVVSMIIILLGFELGKSAVQKILSPEPAETSALTIVILVVSVCVKLYMSFYNRRIAARIDSAAMRATATDSLSDAVATTVVLIAILVMHVTGVNIDGWCGLLVAGFILYAGYHAARDTISPLLGNPPSAEFVYQVEEIVMAHEEVVGMHDLIVHNYGPGRVLVSLHGEVSGDGDIFLLHDQIDLIERELEEKLHCEATIHMDPIETDNEEIARLRVLVSTLAREIHPELTIHDFRMVSGKTHTNLIFDVVAPHTLRLSDQEVEHQLTEKIRAADAQYFAVIRVDRAYS